MTSAAIVAHSNTWAGKRIEQAREDFAQSLISRQTEHSLILRRPTSSFYRTEVLRGERGLLVVTGDGPDLAFRLRSEMSLEALVRWAAGVELDYLATKVLMGEARRGETSLSGREGRRPRPRLQGGPTVTPTIGEILARPARWPLLPPVSCAIVAHERRELGVSPDLEVTLVQENASRGRRLYRVFDGPRYLGSVFRAEPPEQGGHDD